MAWDRTSPATAAAIASSPVRANFVAVDQSLMGQNLVRDPYFIIWPAGDAVAPAHWKIVGAPTIARVTSATNFKTMGMAPSLTGSGTGQLVQTILSTTDFDDVFQSVPISWGCWVKSNTASVAKITIDDGDGSPASSNTHSGSSAWEWLTGTKIIHATSSDRLLLELDSFSGSALTYFDFPTVVFGEIPPQHPIPVKCQKGSLFFPENRGDVLVATRTHAFRAERPFIVTNTSLAVKTAPTGATIIVDVNHDISGTATTMYSTKPTIATSAKAGGADPDGTYQNRCFQGVANAGSDDDTLLTVDVDQVGSTIIGEDLDITIKTLQLLDPLEVYRGATSIGNE